MRSRHPDQGRRPVAYDLSDEYVVEDYIDEGAYGEVRSGTYLPTGVPVAIKRIAPFGKPDIFRRTIREIKLLQHFNHENIVAMLDVTFVGSAVYLVQERMDMNLHDAIKVNKDILDDSYCKYFTYQLLRGLKAIHSAGVIHRDIKSTNILVNGNCDLKICDFGLARTLPARDHHDPKMSEYVATRWYRAPEIILDPRNYTQAVDLWAAGCVLAEMMGKHVLFPGRDYMHQLRLIFGVIGKPDEADMESTRCSSAVKWIQQHIRGAPINWADRFPEAHPWALNLLDNLLLFDRRRRLTAAQALAHPYLTDYHDPVDEPTATPIRDNEYFVTLESLGSTKDLSSASPYIFDAEHAADRCLGLLSTELVSKLVAVLPCSPDDAVDFEDMQSMCKEWKLHWNILCQKANTVTVSFSTPCRSGLQQWFMDRGYQKKISADTVRFTRP